AVDIFERTHPECVGVFVFDNATSHKAFAEDALVASKMNLGPGGTVPKMRDTMWNGDRQSMIIEEDHFGYGEMEWHSSVFHAKKKEVDPNVIDCCARRLMSNQPDFLEQHGRIQQEIESHGHKVLFYSKFHLKFNYIEMYWGMAKRYTRSHCEYSLSKTRETIYEAFDSISIEQIRAFARLSYRWMDAYRHELTGKVAEYAVKKSRKHRTINEEIMNRVNEFLK
ncbi:10036_t:CDS:2, partial [Scutellospora calospora]